jgi:hypothetical protein
MFWNRKKSEPVLPQKVQAAPPTVEIIAHKNATEKQVQEVREANEKLQRVFDRNHFTVKLYVATGGRAPKAKT